LAQVITSAAPTAAPNLVQIRPLGASGQMGEILRKIFLFIYLYLFYALLSILGVKSPENPNFWGVNRRFQAKLAKY